MDSNKVSAALGDGGYITDQFIQDEIISRFSNPTLNQMEDSNLISIKKKQLLISTDSFIVDPPFFPNSNIGELAIAGTLNDILASGGEPLYITLSLIISEGFSFEELTQILDSVRKTAEQAKVMIVAGDTKTLFLGKEKPSIFINTTGLGVPIISPEVLFSISNAQSGDNVIVTGNMGNHGLSVLSAREGLGFETRVFSDCQALSTIILPLVKKFHAHIHCMRDPTRGGLSGVLVDIAMASKVDIHVDYSLIPIQKEVAFGCEMLGIDPIDLVNEGKMVIIVSAEKTNDILYLLREHPFGEKSAVIGQVTETNTREGRVILRKGVQKKLISKRNTAGIPRLC